MPKTLVVDETNLWMDEESDPDDPQCGVQGCMDAGFSCSLPERDGNLYLCDAHALMLGHCFGCGIRTLGVGPDKLHCDDCVREGRDDGMDHDPVYLAYLLGRIAEIHAELA